LSYLNQAMNGSKARDVLINEEQLQELGIE